MYKKKVSIFVITLIFFLFSIEIGTADGQKDFTFQCFATNGKIDQSLPRFASPNQDPITIQVSNRVTHQLISRIFAIFLREKLNYKNVQLIDSRTFRPIDNEHDKLYLTLDRLVPEQTYGWPVATLDLEVWLLSDYHVIPPEIKDAGAIAGTGRFGWFIPKLLIGNGELPELYPYSMFLDKNRNIVRQFAIDQLALNKIMPFIDKNCEKNLKNCTYTPPKCNNNNNNNCAILLAPHFQETAFVIKHIKEFRLNVKVIWFGDNLRHVIKILLHLYTNDPTYFVVKSKFMILHWTPSDIIDGGNIEYEPVTMPKCENIKSSNETGCKYEMTPLLKYYAFGFEKADYAVEALNNFYFRKKEMKSLLGYFENEIKNDTTIDDDYKLIRNELDGNELENKYNQVACNWMKNNPEFYHLWIPIRKETEDIYIGGIFPITGANMAYQGIVDATEMAEMAINANKTILPNHRLTVYKLDGQCRSDIVMKNFINYYLRRSSMIGVLGPACSETVEPIAGVSKHFRMAVISYSAEGATFSDRKTYPYFFRTIGENRHYEHVYLQLLKQLNWKRVAALTEDGQKYTEYISHMENLLKKNDIELISNKKFPKDLQPAEMQRNLIDLKMKNAKIIIADIYDNVAQVVMCEAYKLGMTARDGYVWFLPAWLSKNGNGQMNVTRWYENVNCTEKELLDALNGHFSLSHAPYGDDNQMIQENKTTVKKWREKYYERLNNKSELIPQSDYAGYAYDAVWVYALAFNQLIEEDPTYLSDLHSINTTKRLMELIWATDFYGVSGHIRFGEGGSRFSTINILQWINNESIIVGSFYPNISINKQLIGGELFLNESLIVWLSQSIRPDDGTFICSLGAFAEFLNTDCDNAIFILTSVGCIMIVVLLSIASFLFWKRQYDKKLQASARYMRNFGIDLLSATSIPGNTLDKWEIPKDRIVVNRKLGEGAFGTVYGGEAQITENGWTAVAVKTLKAGSTTEDRLDFLAEAEAMKRFDHKNIIKLLGVCLQTEPIYTVIEFMLYGDLKTYLLARRHLVNEKITDDSDISAKRLTMMALDVARGLSYLADMKYVHRDIACRNCLVNAQRIVKLGDFGMARPMFENDYYKFNRKGMLPVRWMAPESLGLGIFTPASDVWSYGVLLYEIITFGSFPFQGMTNNQVLEHVKNRNTMTIPNGVKPHLEGLMKACWAPEYKKRPTASEIAEFISNYPRLVTPCLDVPLASVQMAETESDEMELLPGLRNKRSASPQPKNGLSLSATINNLDSNGIIPNHSIRLNNFNLPPDITVDNLPNGSSNAYNPIEPLLRLDSEISKSNSSLRRYVPMCGFGKTNRSPSLDRDYTRMSTSNL